VVCAATGEIRTAQIFVAVLVPNYTFAEATWSQSLLDWLAAMCGPLIFWWHAGYVDPR